MATEDYSTKEPKLSHVHIRCHSDCAQLDSITLISATVYEDLFTQAPCKSIDLLSCICDTKPYCYVLMFMVTNTILIIWFMALSFAQLTMYIA